jgi:hypothetical protein
VFADTVKHELLDLGGSHARDAACFGLSLLHDRVRHIVPVAHPELVGVRRAHAVAAVVEDTTGEDGGRALEPNPPVDGVGGELGLHGLEQVTVEDRLVLPAMQLAPVSDFANVEPVLQQIGEGAHAEADAPHQSAVGTATLFGPDPAAIEVLDQGAHRAKRKIAGEYSADGLRLLGHHDELLVDAPIAERNRPPDPNALALGGRDLVAHPLADHLALELGEREQHIEGEPAHAARGVE